MEVLRLLFDSTTLHTLALTMEYASVSLVISILISSLMSFFMNEKLARIFRFIFVLPSFAYALLTLFTLKFLGVIDRYSMFSVSLAWIIASVPFLSLSFEQAKRDLDQREKEALISLGAGPIRAWYSFDFSRTLGSQVMSWFQQFWLYLTSFSLVMILGGGPPNETLEVAIYTSIRLDQVNLHQAFAFAIWQFLILGLLRLCLLGFHRRTGQEWSSVLLGSKKTSSLVQTISLGAFLLFLSSFIFKSENPQALLFATFQSLALGLGLTIFCVVMAAFLYRTKLKLLAEAGAFISPMILGLLWWKFFAFVLPPLLNVILVQLILFLPWYVRLLYPLLDRKRTFDLEAAATLGAAPLRAWFLIEWPRLKPAIRQAMSLVFFLSISEVGAVLLFQTSQFEPLAVSIQNSFLRFQLSEGGLGTLVLVTISYLALEWGGRQKG